MPKPRNEIVVRAVRRDVSYAVFDAVSGAVDGDVDWAVYDAVFGAVSLAVDGAAYWAVGQAVNEDSPHPAIHDFLRFADVEKTL